MMSHYVQVCDELQLLQLALRNGALLRSDPPLRIVSCKLLGMSFKRSATPARAARSCIGTCPSECAMDGWTAPTRDGRALVRQSTSQQGVKID